MKPAAWRLVEEIDAHDPSELGEHLLAAVDRRRGGTPPADDQTLIVLAHSDTSPPRPSIGRSVRTLAKMIGLSRV